MKEHEQGFGAALAAMLNVFNAQASPWERVGQAYINEAVRQVRDEAADELERLSPPVRGRVEGARELLAAELEAEGFHSFAANARGEEGDGQSAIDCCVRAIESALSASSGRAAIIEECAKVADARYADDGWKDEARQGARVIAASIRALTPAAPTLPEV